IVQIVSLLSENPESYMFHYPNIHLTKLQAEAMNMPIITWKTEGEKEKELKDLKGALEAIKNEVDIVSAGALASQYQYERVKKICDELGLEVFTPLWHINLEKHWKNILKSGFVVMVTAVACEGLGKEWLGRIIDHEAFEQLKSLSEKYKFHLGFEGGEAETLILDGPIFRKKLVIQKSEIVWDGKTSSGCVQVKGAALADKN
ncbi:MAG: diphthine--ammonia ligase, partial [Candidatus Aenigmarchaeota archaeon]|nr:diphthine--ammonia ligase [Candidatus Aenigmarchaeota archaeon]